MNGTVAGRYRLVEPLGGGGTSLVYRAGVSGGGPDVALKMLRPQFSSDPSLRRRFLREAELARPLEHPGIVALLDAGEEGENPFLVLELVEAETLRQCLDRQGPLDVESAWAVFVALARALDYAHARGVIHRDVKPQNIFVSGTVVKLADFGNARVVSLASVTGASLTWGTPEYIAPEMFGRGRADPRSDLYGLGIVLHEMLTGRLPWSRAETLTRLGGRAGAAPAFAPTGAGEAVDRLLAELLAFSPSDRPASGEEALARVARSSGAAIVRKTSCSSCGAPRPEDVPRCFSCGAEMLRFAHDASGRWRLILERLEDDATATENLLRVLDPLVEPLNRPLNFLTGDLRHYSESERKAGIGLPAVLFNHLDEKTARELEALSRRNGLAVHTEKGTNRGQVAKLSPGMRPRDVALVGGAVCLSAVSMIRLGHHAYGMVLFPVLVFGSFVALMAGKAISGRWRRRRARGIFRLRASAAPVLVADGLLAGAARALQKVRAPEVRALLGDLATEVYRLTRRAATLDAGTESPSSEAELVRRTVAAAPALVERLEQLAIRVDALDGALEGASDGELMQSLGRLERTASAPGADRGALATARGDLEAMLARRHAAEQDRARLAATLCRMLGRLRELVARTRSLQTPDDEEARTLEAASAELEAFLAPGN